MSDLFRVRMQMQISYQNKRITEKYYDGDRPSEMLQLRVDLLEAKLGIEAHHIEEEGWLKPRARTARPWLRFVKATREESKNPEAEYPHAAEILSVERLKLGEWIPVQIQFIPPQVLVDLVP